MANVEHVELTVRDNGIRCEGCESRIERVLGRLPGVAQVKAERKTQTVSLALDTDQMPLDQVREKLEFAGFRTA